jgi:DNA-binding NarL/FixJ family response regulator
MVDATGSPARPLRVLLIDDNRAMRLAVAGLLKDEGIEVVGEAEDGAAGVELAERLGPDVVVTDVRMPVLDGISATRRIREIAPSTQVVVHTLFDAPLMADRARAAGAFALVPKGGKPRRICDAVFAAAAHAGDQPEPPAPEEPEPLAGFDPLPPQAW